MPTQAVTSVTIPPQQLKELVYEAALAALAEHEKRKVDTETLITNPPALELLSVSKVTLHQWRWSGKIPYRRIGKRIYYSKSDLLAAMEKSPLSKRRAA